MNADGLYFDAIDDYSDDRVDDIEGTAQKFRGVFENFSMSGWAASAHAYLARYFTRTFFVQEDHPPSSLDMADDVYADLFQRMNTYRDKEDVELSAYYFGALNSALRGDLEIAQERLEAIDHMSSADELDIYVDCLFRGFGELCEGPIDDFVDARLLVSATRQALEDVETANTDIQALMDNLVEGVLGTLEEKIDYVVIAGTVKGEEEAETLAQHVNDLLSRSDTDLIAEVYSPDDGSEYRAVVIKNQGDDEIRFSREDADEVRARALKMDLEEKPYLWEID
ncbi:MAG: hypothetical protein ACR2RE_09545, partial [Geminicoccaceae bacterium]